MVTRIPGITGQVSEATCPPQRIRLIFRLTARELGSAEFPFGFQYMTHFGLAKFFENMSVGGAHGGGESSGVTENMLHSMGVGSPH